jgi:cation-transporting P-type ATPase E
MSVAAETFDSPAVAEPAASATPLSGLTEAEVRERRARGEGNGVKLDTSRSYTDILRQNVFTFINNILFLIGMVLILMGRWDDAAVTAGVMMLNIIVGVIQEARAKSKLDRIALLTRPKATVVREGSEKTIDPGDIVLGDLIKVSAGDQIVVDGAVRDGQIDADESLLTGESDLIPKRAGDSVYSGSFAVNGSALFEATKVGAASVANQITAGARAFRQIKTPLQQDIDYIIRILIILAFLLGFMLTLSYIGRQLGVVDSVRNAAVIAGLVPQGLFFMIAVSYAVGAVRMSGRGALIQQSNAVESLSNVNVLCLDKTGTLTTNKIKLSEVHPLGIDKEKLEALVGDYAANTSAHNKTSEACCAAYPGEKRTVAEEVPFSSERKWSVIAFNDPALTGVYALGAPEMLKPYLQPGHDLETISKDWVGKGLRVLLFAHHPQVSPLHNDKGDPQLPQGLTPIGFITFSDELRAEAQATIDGFKDAGINLKVISGDNPHTVAALARQAGFGEEIKVVSGLELEKLDDVEFARTAEETSIFGRITPQQKENLVRALRAKGHYVAMIGDGVNDVLSLKQANVGISMQSGSQATRGVADLVLLNDSFAVLPSAFQEGQRIINGMHDVVRLLLARTLYLIFVIVGAAVMQLPFPITPKHNSILAVLTVGIPTVALVAWARVGTPPRRLLRSVTNFVVPAAITVAALALGVYYGYIVMTGGDTPADIKLAQTALTTVMMLCGLILIPFAEPPIRALVAGDEYSGDRRPTIVAAAMLVAFIGIMAVPFSRNFFELAVLPPLDIAMLVGLVAAWAVGLWLVWRTRVLDRIVGKPPSY